MSTSVTLKNSTLATLLLSALLPVGAAMAQLAPPVESSNSGELPGTARTRCRF